MVAAALLGVGVSTAPKAKAANLFWDPNSSGQGIGGNANWNTTSAFWTDSGSNLYVTGYDTAAAKTFTSSDTASFYGTAGTATLTGNITVGGLNFGAPSYTITTGTNTLTFGAADNTIRLNTLAQANATTTVGATITGTVAGTGNITLDGGLAAGLVGNTLTFQGTSTGGWSGTTTINVGQTLKLAGLSQALLNTTGITLNGGGINLTNTTAAEAALDRVSNSATITSNGGTITVANTASASINYAETLGTVALTSGLLTINSSTNNTSPSTQTLTLSGLTHTGSTNTAQANFTGTSLGAAAQNIIAITGQGATAASIAPYMTYGGTDFAGYSATLGVIAATTTTLTSAVVGVSSTDYNAATFTLGTGGSLKTLKFTGGTALTVTGAGVTSIGGIVSTGATHILAGGTAYQALVAADPIYFFVNANQLTVSGPIKSNGTTPNAVVLGGAGTLSLIGTNTFTGNIVLNSGILSYTGNTAATLGNAANAIIANGSATLTALTTGGATARAITLNNGAILSFTNAAIVQTYSGAITGAGGVAINNTSNVATTFSGVNTFTGPINITLGYFTTGSTTATGNANNPVNIANAATTGLTLANNISIGSLSGGGSNGGLVTLAANTLTIGGNNESTTFAGVISSSGSPTTSLIKTGTGILTLTGTSTFTGAVTISNGLVNIGNVRNLGSGTAISVNGGGLQFSPNPTNNSADPSTRTITIGSGGATFDTNGNQVAFENAIGNSGTGGLTKTGNGTLTLAGANTYTGATTVTKGVLNLKNASAVSAGSSVTVAASGSLLLTLAGTNDFGSRPLTISGTGSAAGMPGALVNILGTNTYSGAITLGADATVSAAAGTLALSSASAVTGSGFGLTLTGSGNGTLSGAIQTGAGGLTKTGNGTWTLSGTTANYTGATSLTGGTLSITGGALGSTSGTTLGGGTLALTSGSQNIGNLTVSAGMANTVTVGASSTLTIGSTITRSAGGTVFFDESAASSAVATTATGSGTNNILGWALVKDAAWRRGA